MDSPGAWVRVKERASAAAAAAAADVPSKNSVSTLSANLIEFYNRLNVSAAVKHHNTMLKHNTTNFVTKIKKINVNTYESNVDGLGNWGGKCQCPNGEVYYVADHSDFCESLACYGDGKVIGKCNRYHNKKWKKKQVWRKLWIA